MSDIPLQQFAHRVLRIVYELQFVGRTRAIFASRDSNGNPVLSPDDYEDPPLRFESVPVLALLCELYRPNQDNRALELTLRPAVNYLRTNEWIECHTLQLGNGDGGGSPKEAEVHKGFAVPVHLAIPNYVRPDGVIVSGFWDIPVIDAISVEYYPLGPARLRSWLGHTSHKFCQMFGVRVGEVPIYWVFSRMNDDLTGIRMDCAVKLLLGSHAAHSGYPPDENYVITHGGVAEVERSGRNGHGSEAERKPADPPDGPASPGVDGYETKKPTPPFKRPSDEALAAWRLRDLTGLKTQTAIAAEMTKQLNREVSQGEVSRWLKQVKAYLEAGNILPDLPGMSGKPQSVDPEIFEMGKREDRRTPRQRTRRDSVPD